MNIFLNDINIFVVHTICYTNKGMANEYTFITPCVKFANFFLTIVVDEGLTSEGLEI